MPSAASLSRLFKAIGTRDLGTAARLAETIADVEERSGHRSAAAMLRGALGPNGAPANTLTLTSLDIASALIREEPGPKLTDVVLTQSARRDLDEFTAEWTYRSELAKRGLSRRTKSIFFGPPGCGKTLSARSLATTMGLPIFTVRFSSVVGAYLGQTGANLRAVFRFAEGTPCVLLLDEFDAIGRTRGRADDVGELDRVVISILQELDHTLPAGVVVAASNAPDSLDRAIWRRFDIAVEFPAPTRRQLQEFLKRSELDARAPRRNSRRVPLNLRSYADVEKWIAEQKRRATLHELVNRNGKARRA
jgi:SpoVK/Ycf46/Vps4 family AAA+-type ATPase